MMRRILYAAIFMLLGARVVAQDAFTERSVKYIGQYYKFAIEEQKRAGIPAAITLAQGVLETDGGTSDIMIRGNNHFGIKCKSDYKGDTVQHTDDAPNECFKKYSDALESYKDHSNHLIRNPRYKPLFSLTLTDYASWAIGLKRCGYATNPNYANRLIKLIEDFKLQEFTYYALDSTYVLKLPEVMKLPICVPAPDTVAKPTMAAVVAKPADTLKRLVPYKKDTVVAIVPVTPKRDSVVVLVPTATKREDYMPDTARLLSSRVVVDTVKARVSGKADTIVVSTLQHSDKQYDSGKVIIVNGLKAFYAFKGELLLKYAVKYNVHYPKLLQMNDLDDAPLPDNMLVYLEKKLTTGTHAKHTVANGESLLQIAQTEGMQIKRLMSLNQLAPGDEPAVGAVLELQTMALKKPELKGRDIMKGAVADTSAKKILVKSEYITVDHSKPEEPAPIDTQKKKPEVAVAPVPAAKDSVVPVKVVLASADTATAHMGDEKPESLESLENMGKKDTLVAAKPRPVISNDTLAPEMAPKQLTPFTDDDLAKLKADLDKVVYTPEEGKPKFKEEKPEQKKDVGNNKPEKKKGKSSDDEPETYVVKKGDTLGAIAKKYGVTVKQLVDWNHVDAKALRDGKKLRVSE